MLVDFSNYFHINKLINGINLISIFCDKLDQSFLDSRVKMISEEDNLKIYGRVNNLLENTNLFVKNNFSFLYYQFIRSDKQSIDITENKSFIDYYHNLYKHSKLFVANLDNSITFYDEAFRDEIDLQIIAFFLFVIESNKKEAFPKLNDSDNSYNILNSNKASSVKKSLLKPFKKEDILSVEECETDYGDRRITKQDVKNREDYVKKIINVANKELYDTVEEEMVTGNLKEKHTKVVFNIPKPLYKLHILNNVKF